MKGSPHTIRLSNISEIKLGYQFRKGIISTPNGTAKALELKFVDESAKVDWSRLEKVDGTNIPKQYFAKFGDTLLVARGTKNQTIFVDTKKENVVVPNFIIILRPDTKKIFPEFLTWYFTLPTAKAFLEKIRRGTSVPMISSIELADMLISLPDLETQEKITKLSNLASQANDLEFKLLAIRKTFLNAKLSEKFLEISA